MNAIQLLQRRINVWNQRQGFWTWDENEMDAARRAPTFPLDAKWRMHRAIVVEKLCLIHSEISEALEDVRAGRPFVAVSAPLGGKPEGFPTELADAMIRILDLAEACGIDLHTEIERKMEYNRTRPFKHGKLL